MRNRRANRELSAPVDYEPRPDQQEMPLPGEPRMRVVCPCGAVAGRVAFSEVYAGPDTLPPRLRCKRGHEPRPGLARLRELMAGADRGVIRL